MEIRLHLPLYIKEGEMNKKIAIDGPAGAGKSTIAKKTAEKLGLVYVDTGAMFRAIALYMTEKGIKSNDIVQIKKELEDVALDIIYENGEQQIILNGENVSDSIRKPEISKAASTFAAIPEVRSRLLNLQRELASKRPVVMDGRDIGSKVLPEATVKIEEIMSDIKSRDEQDMKRAVSPLIKVEDAVLVDTSSLSIDEVVDEIIKIACEKNPDFC